jgi:hypothetical protein
MVVVRRRSVALALAFAATGCTAPPPTGPEPAKEKPATAATASSEPVPTATVATAACPEDMVLVEGAFCPAAAEECEAHDPEYDANHDKSERCLKFTSPSRCVSSKRELMRFCVDRYEWPNRAGERPAVLVDFHGAETACEGTGKRLCEEPEWTFACEGEAMLPYVNGYERDPTACVIDRPWMSRPTTPFKQWDGCMADDECRRAFGKLDQREPSGSFPRCVSPFGAFDMNGNVNEWVDRPGERYPNRSGLKGGWWGPVRDRCRPTVRFHNESDWGYEIGFRCCKDAKP